MKFNLEKRVIFIFILAIVLRFWNLAGNPPALYWDEASLGYNAYAIATTGRDEHGEFLPLTRFIAYGDYKPPGYIYATVPFIWIFGLNEFSVRFVSALSGSLTVLITYYLVKLLFSQEKLFLNFKFFKFDVPIISMALLAVSPWHLQFSRGAFEANLATFFSVLGIWLFYLSKNKIICIFASVFSFVLSIYTFNTHRVFLPFLILFLLIINFRFVIQRWIHFLLALILAILLLFPLYPFLNSREGQLRFEEVTFLNDLEPVEIANQRIDRENNNFIANLMHNRRVQFTKEFFKHLFDHLTANFLFFHGDVNPRLGTQENGTLYLIDMPLILLGLFWLSEKNRKLLLLLLGWFVLGILPASLARETPHALRTLNVLPVPQIIISIGFIYLIKLSSKISYLKYAIIAAYLISVVSYLHTYHSHYAYEFAASWQYGYKELVEFVVSREKDYDKIFITQSYGRPYIYFLFYEKYSPTEYLRTRDAERDWFGFWSVSGFGKYRFGDIPSTSHRESDKWLLVAAPGGLPKESRYIGKITFPNGDTAFELADVR
jgi:4-amino-4-deoxy-L-arabinose transferase-like glycosyltransferase